MLDSFYWINEPEQWQCDNGKLSVVTNDKTDFWQKTWYGFERFSGHIFATDVSEDFTFQVKVCADFTTLYDQAGLMFMTDDRHWLKAGIEFNDGAPAIGSVLTLENSDWATGTFTGDPRELLASLDPQRQQPAVTILNGGSSLAAATLVLFSAGPSENRCDVLYA